MSSLESLNTAAAAAGFAFVLSEDVAKEGMMTDPNAAKWRALDRSAAEQPRETQSLTGLVNDLVGALRSRVPA